jgi:hypothetical protein
MNRFWRKLKLTLSMARANPDELIRETSQKATELES